MRSKLDAIRKIILIEKFVKKINSQIEVDFRTNEFYCDIDENTIGVCLTKTDIDADRFYEKFLTEYFGEKFNLFLMSILHEIGHIETYDEETDNERDLIYSLLQLNYTEEKIEDYNNKYFMIPSELNATTWAVNFYRQNKKFCDTFIKKYLTK